ncbi:hypothetical protein L210DRAFT_3548711 [Boletus edulis BED1]|uniref:Uncharacterized protein n=1 Tax=Boletus edulis BED1 TaxID=1328754 RepID=A0AAD4GCC0_BOLED|nr:hypothetical protein L210DRAFT_3548711 [Boletus edulis BED1]
MLDDAHDNALNQAVVISATSAAKISVRDGWTGVMDKLDQVGTSNDDSDAVPTLKSYWLWCVSHTPRYTSADTVGHTRDAWHLADLSFARHSQACSASTQPCDGTAIAAVSLSPGSELVLIRFGGQFYSTILMQRHRRFRRLPTPPVIQGTPPPLNIYMPSTDTWTTVYPTPDLEHGLVPL